MWDIAFNDQKILYKKLILGFASLSDAFAQKAVDDEEKEEKDEEEKLLLHLSTLNFRKRYLENHLTLFRKTLEILSYDSSIIRKKIPKMRKNI